MKDWLNRHKKVAALTGTLAALACIAMGGLALNGVERTYETVHCNPYYVHAGETEPRRDYSQYFEHGNVNTSSEEWQGILQKMEGRWFSASHNDWVWAEMRCDYSDPSIGWHLRAW